MVGGFLAYRELEALRGFFATPGAFTDVFGIQDLIPKDISFLEEKDIHMDIECQYFLTLLAHRTVTSMELNQIKNNDLLIYCTPEGVRQIEQKMNEPEDDDLLKSVRKQERLSPEYYEKSECHHIMRFQPLRNYELVKWCMANHFKDKILDFNHLKELKKIHKHYREITMTGRIDARECYKLFYRPYMNAIYALRNVYSHSRKFLRAAKKYRDIWVKTEKQINWLPIWDNTIVMFQEKEHKKDFLTNRIEIEDNAEYPLHIGKKTFFASLMMWTFVGKNWDDICSNRWQKGPVFESRVEQELNDRKVNVIDKNIQLSPNDEIDFLCEKDDKFFMIEAKNYGPNWDYNYLSTSKYEGRIEEMNSKIALAPRRLALIDSDREKFGIPHNAALQGIIVTSFIEPNMNVPTGFISLSIDKLNKVFGKKSTMPKWTKGPAFQIPENILKEAHRKMGLLH